MNALAYSTNSMTSTPDDLRSMSPNERIRRPIVAKQPFSRLTDPLGLSREIRVSMVAARTVGTEPA